MFTQTPSHYEKGGGLSWEGPVTPEQAAPEPPTPLPKYLVMAREACPGRILTPVTPSTLWTFRSI